MSDRLPQHVSSISPLGDAIDGTRPVKLTRPKARPRARPVLREVTSGVVCFCGERFGEGRALEFMLHLRAEVGEDLAVLERHRAGNRRYLKERRKSDPDWYRSRLDASNKAHKEARDRSAADRMKPCACGCGGMTKGYGLTMQGHRLSKRTKEEQLQRRRNWTKERARCPECGLDVNKSSISRHRRRAHPSS